MIAAMTPTSDREIEMLIAKAEPGVNDLMRAYEVLEAQYSRAAQATTVRTTVVASANTRVR